MSQVTGVALVGLSVPRNTIRVGCVCVCVRLRAGGHGSERGSIIRTAEVFREVFVLCRALFLEEIENIYI